MPGSGAPARFGRGATVFAASLALAVGITALRDRVFGDRGPAVSVDTRLLIDQVNVVRAQASCPPLRVDPELTAMAQAQARDMAARQFLSSVNPDNKDPTTVARAAGYPGAVTESFAAGLTTPTEVVTQWINVANPRSGDVARRLRTCSMISAGAGHDPGTALPSLSPNVWVLVLGDS